MKNNNKTDEKIYNKNTKKPKKITLKKSKIIVIYQLYLPSKKWLNKQ